MHKYESEHFFEEGYIYKQNNSGVTEKTQVYIIIFILKTNFKYLLREISKSGVPNRFNKL